MVGSDDIHQLFLIIIAYEDTSGLVSRMIEREYTVNVGAGCQDKVILALAEFFDESALEGLFALYFYRAVDVGSFRNDVIYLFGIYGHQLGQSLAAEAVPPEITRV